MLRERIHALRTLHLVIDLLLTGLAYGCTLGLVHLIRPGSLITLDFTNTDLLNLLAVGTIWGILVSRQKQSYLYRTQPIPTILKSVLRLVVVGGLFFAAWLIVGRHLGYGRLFLATFVAIDFIFLAGLRLTILGILHHYRKHGRNQQTALIVGTGKLARKLVRDIDNAPQWGIKVLGFIEPRSSNQLRRYWDIPVVGSLRNMPDIIKAIQVDFVVFALSPDYLGGIDAAIGLCEEMGTRAYLMVDFFVPQFGRRELQSFLGTPAVCYETTPRRGWALSAKGIVDRIGAGIGLAFIAPLLLVIAALIKATSRGPVFFKQIRCGLNGRRFEMLKFRTMVEDADQLKEKLATRNEMDGPAFKIKDDPRITPIGRILRKTSLDELPQLINVVRGEMSLIGPRPPLPDEVIHYHHWHRRRLSIPPGMTCLWQVGDRNESKFDDWVKQDLEYIDNWSPLLDMRIMVRTISTVLRGTGQ